MIDLLASLAGGGLTGLIGSVLTTGMEIKKQKLRDEHQLKVMEMELKSLELEQQGRERQVLIQAEGQAFAASLEADKASYGKGAGKWAHWLDLVDVVRGLTRPVLTMALCGAAVYLWATAPESGEDAQIKGQVAATLLYMASTAVVWWFGSRQKAVSK